MVSAICAATLVFYVTAMSERLLSGQIRDAVAQEVTQVQRAYDAGGMNLLLRTMERRARQPGANLYLIAGPSGDILAGNVASVQGPCAQGYAKAAPGGRMQLSTEQMRQVDTDKNGNISKQEFDAACANQLFEQSKKQ